MKRRIRFSNHPLRFLLPAVLALLVFQIPHTACGQTARSLARTVDPLEIPGNSLPGMIGTRLESICVSALRNGQWVRIPFQIDERRPVRTESGKTLPDYVFPEAPLADADDDPSFDGDDLLVFLSRDLGDRAGRGGGRGAGGQACEIEVTDPRDGSKGWAYVSVRADGPAESAEDEVIYLPDDGILEGRRYRIRMSKENPLLYEQLILKGDPGGESAGERNIIDRFKMRARASLPLPFLRFRRNESDLRSREIGWIDGPVRVVRRTETRVDLLLGLTTPGQVQDTFFYPDHFLFWVELSSPVPLARLVSDAEIRLSADLNTQAQGMVFVTRDNPDGFVVDGFMSPEERNVETHGQDWYAISDGVHTLFNRLVLPRGSPFRLSLVYVDDRRLSDPPERVPGRWGDAGYCLKGIAAAKKGRTRLLIHTLIGEGYRADDERAFLDMIDLPLSWTCCLPEQVCVNRASRSSGFRPGHRIPRPSEQDHLCGAHGTVRHRLLQQREPDIAVTADLKSWLDG